jgi:peptide deformylase
MAILPILQLGDEILRRKSEPVEKFDAELCNLLNDMRETLINAKGAGLAAPQVGVNKRIFLVDTEETGIIEFINPVVLGTSGSQYGVEGCLSVKGKWGDVKRPRKITIEAYDRYGEIMSTSITVNSMSEAQTIKKNYEAKPDGVYRGVLFSLTGKLEYIS